MSFSARTSPSGNSALLDILTWAWKPRKNTTRDQRMGRVARESSPKGSRDRGEACASRRFLTMWVPTSPFGSTWFKMVEDWQGGRWGKVKTRDPKWHIHLYWRTSDDASGSCLCHDRGKFQPLFFSSLLSDVFGWLALPQAGRFWLFWRSE
ncbi:uncharacterized protein YALI1_F05887g [Yarrowia lipolytica]|uniref:Uncharacterized protein n=1 Tax=Yarrowia lipolytica TaxID=4952 RepID=A0A1D8NLV3_YARLL|nr:hypothetical protein YALI1_F05887g [Yarrowia lipolytica]